MTNGVYTRPEQVMAAVEVALRNIRSDLDDPELEPFEKVRDIAGVISSLVLDLRAALKRAVLVGAYGTALQVLAALDDLAPGRAGLARSARCVKELMQRAEADLDVRVAPDEEGLNP
jgi:hypothetical protein